MFILCLYSWCMCYKPICVSIYWFQTNTIPCICHLNLNVPHVMSILFDSCAVVSLWLLLHTQLLPLVFVECCPISLNCGLYYVLAQSVNMISLAVSPHWHVSLLDGLQFIDAEQWVWLSCVVVVASSAGNKGLTFMTDADSAPNTSRKDSVKPNTIKPGIILKSVWAVYYLMREKLQCVSFTPPLPITTLQGTKASEK